MSAVTVTIVSNGASMDPSFQLQSADVVKEVNRIPYAQLILLDGDTAKRKFTISDNDFFEPGKEIEVKLRYEGDNEKETSVFKGLVTKQIIEASEQGTLLTVELKDAAVKLTNSRRSAIYRDKSDNEIVHDLINKANLQGGDLKDTHLKHSELVQYYATDWDFILSRAEAYGLAVIADDGTISLKEYSLGSDEKHSFEFGISEIYGFEIEVDATHQRAGIESIAWDIKNQKLTKASQAKDFALAQGNLKADLLAKAVGGKLEKLANPIPLSSEILQSWADAAMVRSRMSMIRGHISIPGFGDIHRMEVMKIKGIGDRVNGKTLITGVRHRIDSHSWQTDIQFGLSPERFAAQHNIMDAPAAGLLPAVHGLQIGVVDKFKEDSDKEFRVKVILPGLDETDGAVWARLASPDAGKNRGYFFRPEAGDEVVVGFFNDDPCQAVILGAMYGSKNSPPDKVSKLTKGNIEKGIFSKQGSALAFTDNDKPSVLIKTPNSSQITLDDDAAIIQISDQHGNSIKMSKDGIEIKSAQKLILNAKGDIEITGASVEVK